MRSRTSQWFEIGVRFEKKCEDGTLKKVTEQHVIEALSFTEAENRITKVANEFVSGEFTVKTEVEAPYREFSSLIKQRMNIGIKQNLNL